MHMQYMYLYGASCAAFMVESGIYKGQRISRRTPRHHQEGDTRVLVQYRSVEHGKRSTIVILITAALAPCHLVGMMHTGPSGGQPLQRELRNSHAINLRSLGIMRGPTAWRGGPELKMWTNGRDQW
jgi:hypothetical protein